jgi:hypothetical protein
MFQATTAYNKATPTSPRQASTDERAATIRRIAGGNGITIEAVMTEFNLTRHQAGNLLSYLRRSGRAVPPTVKATAASAGPVCPRCGCDDIEPWNDGYYCAGNCAMIFKR